MYQVQNIFIIDGVSGSGKSTFIDLLIKEFNNIEYIPEITTRPIRNYEKKEGSDKLFVTKEEFIRMNLKYVNEYFDGNLYGYDWAAIELAMKKSGHLFLSSELPFIEKMPLQKYGKIITILIETSEDLIKSRLEKVDMTIEQRTYRLSRLQANNRAKEQFTHVISNNRTVEEFLMEIINILKIYNIHRCSGVVL